MTTFKKLHQQLFPLLIGNVWDVPSAKIAESTGFQALGTSSAAIAKMLGYEDGEAMTFEELYYIVKRIKINTQLPLSVDLESGYSRNPIQITQHILQLANLGVVGINLEDSVVKENRVLLPAEAFSDVIVTIRKELTAKNIAMFLNVRTDTFLLNVPNIIQETLRRVKLYEKAGADGIFVPGIQAEVPISTIVKNTKLPINVMCMPNLPNFETLQKLGVQRISMGNFAFEKNYTFFEQIMEKVKIEQSFASL